MARSSAHDPCVPTRRSRRIAAAATRTTRAASCADEARRHILRATMRVLDQFTVARRYGTGAPATIELLEGDLSAVPPEHAVDALVVSAFPNSYTPNPGTLFKSLFEHGLDMQEVA